MIIKDKGINGWKKDNRIYYIVKSGDNLSKIAEMFHVKLSDIVSMNPQIKNPNLIYSGNKVRVK